MRNSGRVLLWGIGLAIVGGAAFTAGIAAAFGRAGGWSDRLAWVGALTLVVAGVLAVVATCMGIGEAIRERRINWSLPVAIVGVALALWAAWVAVHL